MTKDTRVVTIEGIDGSGKGLQFGMLAKRLADAGLSVDMRDYPRYDMYFGRQVGALLSGSEGVAASTVDGKSMALWFALDRWDDLKGYRMGEYDILLINRYVLSNAVYQSVRDIDADKPDIVEWVMDLEYNRFCIPRPALNVFFDVDPDRAGANVDNKGFRGYVGSGRDVYEANAGMQSRARAKFLECAEAFDDIAVIQCMGENGMLPPDEINDRLVSVLTERGIIAGVF